MIRDVWDNQGCGKIRKEWDNHEFVGRSAIYGTIRDAQDDQECAGRSGICGTIRDA